MALTFKPIEIIIIEIFNLLVANSFSKLRFEANLFSENSQSKKRSQKPEKAI